MAERRFYTASSRSVIEDLPMDIVSVVLGIVMFAVLFGMILAIDKI